MFGDVGNELAVDVDRAAVLQRLDVFGSGLAGTHASTPSIQLKIAYGSDQAIDALDVVRGKSADPVVGPPAARIGADDRNLVRAGRVRQRDGDAVVVRADVKRV